MFNNFESFNFSKFKNLCTKIDFVSSINRSDTSKNMKNTVIIKNILQLNLDKRKMINRNRMNEYLDIK